MTSAKSDISRDEFVAFYGEGVYREARGIPGELVELLRPIGRYDYLGLLTHGLSWAIEPLATLQPISYAALRECAGPLELGAKFATRHFMSDPPSAFRVAMFESQGRMVEIFPSFAGDTFESGNHCFESLFSLPDALSRSWLWRTDGWRIPGEVYEGRSSNRRLVAHPSVGWQQADDYLDTLGRGWKKRFLPGIVEKFPDCFVPASSKYDCDHYLLDCFLDTRPASISGPTGDQFFVVSTRRDQIVYHVHKGDVANLRVLHDPADAIDRYSAHALRNLPGEFDFSPWSEPYVA